MCQSMPYCARSSCTAALRWWTAVGIARRLDYRTSRRGACAKLPLVFGRAARRHPDIDHLQPRFCSASMCSRSAMPSSTSNTVGRAGRRCSNAMGSSPCRNSTCARTPMRWRQQRMDHGGGAAAHATLLGCLPLRLPGKAHQGCGSRWGCRAPPNCSPKPKRMV